MSRASVDSRCQAPGRMPEIKSSSELETSGIAIQLVRLLTGADATKPVPCGGANCLVRLSSPGGPPWNETHRTEKLLEGRRLVEKGRLFRDPCSGSLMCLGQISTSSWREIFLGQNSLAVCLFRCIFPAPVMGFPLQSSLVSIILRPSFAPSPWRIWRVKAIKAVTGACFQW